MSESSKMGKSIVPPWILFFQLLLCNFCISVTDHVKHTVENVGQQERYPDSGAS